MSAISYTAIPTHAKMSSSRTYPDGAISNSVPSNSSASSILGSYAYHLHQQQQQQQQHQQVQMLIEPCVSSSSSPPSSSSILHVPSALLNTSSTSPPLNCSSPRVRKNSKESIHSGHFMISEIDEDACEPLVESATVHQSDIEQEETLQVEKAGKNFTLESVETKQEYKYGPDTDPRTVTIDASLSKLLQCMSIAYRGKLTSPKWKTFKGLKLRPKDKIRLNNIIWRCWHMQYVTGMDIEFCQFATTLDVHNKPEAILLEGKYWKRGTRAVKAEYKKWRMYYREKCYIRSQYEAYSSSSIDLSSSFSESDLRSSNSMTDSFGFDDTFMSGENSLWSSLMSTPNSFGFPSSREINRSGFGADCIQPCLSQLQPPIYDFMDFEDILTSPSLSLSSNVSRNQQVSILPTLPEEPQMECSSSDTNGGVTHTVTSKSLTNQQSSSQSSSMHVLSDMNVDSGSSCIGGTFEHLSSIPQQSTLNSPLTTQYIHDSMNNITVTATPSSSPASTSNVHMQIHCIYDSNKKVNTFLSPSSSEFTFTPPLRVTSNNTQQQQASPQQQQSQQFTSNQVTNDQKPYTGRRTSSNATRPSIAFTTVDANVSESRFLVPQQPLSLKSNRSIQPQQQQPQLHHQQILSSVNSSHHHSQSQPSQSQSQPSSMSLQSVSSTIQPMYLSTLTNAITSSISSNPIQQQQQQQQQLKSSPNVTLNSQVNGSSSSTISSSSSSGKVPFERSSSLPIYQSIEFMSHNPLVTSPSPLAPYQSTPLTNITASAEAVSTARGDNLFIKSVAPVESTLSKDSVIAQLLSSPTPAVALSRTHSNQSVLLQQQQQQQQSSTQATYQTAIPHSSKYVSLSTSGGSNSNVQAVTVTPYVASRVTTGKSEARVRFSDDSAYPRAKQSTTSGPVRKLSSPARICSNHPAAALPPSHLSKDALVSSHVSSKLSKKGNQDKIKYQEHRRVCHINAEQKRRCNIKNGFDTLRAILPCINQSASAKISKAQMLQKAAEHIQVLKAEWQEKQSEYETWKKEIDTLNQTINVFQSQLPATGAPVGCQRTGRAKEMFRAYVQSRTQENWKFFIFSQIMEPLLESYDSTVSTSSAEELRKSTHLWLDQNCSLVNLRKGVLNSLRHLSTTSSILTNPSALPGEALQAVATRAPPAHERGDSRN